MISEEFVLVLIHFSIKKLAERHQDQKRKLSSSLCGEDAEWSLRLHLCVAAHRSTSAHVAEKPFKK